MNWHQRFKNMKKALAYTNADIAQITGHTPNTIKHITQPKKEFPRWLKLPVVIYEIAVRKLLISFLQWFFDNESNIEGDPSVEDFVDIFLNIKNKTNES